MSPDAAPIQETSPLAPEKPRITHAEILRMDEGQLMDYITGDLKDAAEGLYGISDTETLLVFLGGSKKHDISRIRTQEGKRVYTKKHPYPKWAEIYEFMGAANNYTENKGPLSAFVSEAADLAYNLALLSKADARHEQEHLDQITQIASILGWRKHSDPQDPASPLTNRELLRLAAFKYHQRFVDAAGDKSTEEEDSILEKLLEVNTFMDNAEPLVSSPTKEQVGNAFKWGSKFIRKHLQLRYGQVVHEKKMIRKAEKARKKEAKLADVREALDHEANDASA